MTISNAVAKLSGADLDALEGDLFDVESELGAGEDSRGEIDRNHPASPELALRHSAAEHRREIIGIYRHGINIASSVEATSLVALLQHSNMAIPPKLALAQQKGYSFYRFDIVFTVNLPEGIWPDEAEFAVELFGKDRTVPPNISVQNFFPQEVYDELIKAESSVEMGLTGDLAFAIPDEIANQIGLKQASAGLVASANVAFSPFKYQLRRARIRADGINTSRVQWHYRLASELSGRSEFQSWVIAKIPESIKQVCLDAELGVLPYKREWLLFHKQLKVLRQSLNLQVAL